MKKSHAGFWVGIAVFFIAAVYSVILFLAKPTIDSSAWVLYGATMVAFLLAGIQMITASGSGTAVVIDTALGIVTAIYFGLQLLFGGIVFMCLNNLPLIPVIVCEIILLAVYLVLAFFMYAAQSSNRSDRQAVTKMRLLESDILNMMEEAANPEVKKALKELAEAIHYSDVVSLPGLEDVEGRIAQNVAVLQDELTEEGANPLARIEKIRRLLKERDRTAAILKR